MLGLIERTSRCTQYLCKLLARKLFTWLPFFCSLLSVHLIDVTTFTNCFIAISVDFSVLIMRQVSWLFLHITVIKWIQCRNRVEVLFQKWVNWFSCYNIPHLFIVLITTIYLYVLCTPFEFQFFSSFCVLFLFAK